MIVSIGDDKADHSGPYQRYIQAQQLYKYDDNQDMANDIALIKLERYIEFNVKVQVACLPTSGLKIPPQTPVTVVGWGKLQQQSSGNYSD